MNDLDTPLQDKPPPALQLPKSVSPMDLVARAVESGNIDLVERMLALQERWQAMEAKKAFDAAMADACAEMPILVKETKVDYQTKDRSGRVSYRHEDLAAVVEKVAPILGKHGLYHSFVPVTEPNRITVSCIITHKLGHSVHGNPLSGPPDTSGSKNSLQAIGSTITYLSRYALKAALGLAAAVDDDAQSAGPAPYPVAGPDPMRPTQEVSQQPSPPTQQRKQEQQAAPLTCWEKEIIKDEARLAADHGQLAFDAFWKRMNTLAARNVITDLGTELRQRIDAADAGADSDTGELANDNAEAKPEA